MALARTHFFAFLLFCGIISVAFYYSEIRNHSNNGPSSNTFVGRNKRRTNLFEEGYVNDNSTQENNQYDDTIGSCHFNFSVADTENAHSFFTRELPEKEYNAVYIYLKNAHTTGSNDARHDHYSNEWNGLQEWMWIKPKSKYHSLNLPVDLDSLTFTISKYGTHRLTISWTLPINCNLLTDNDSIYNNETENIVKYLWSNVVGNRTNTEICHRNFDRDKDITSVIWWITTVWVGYDYDCYPINSLIEGYIENCPISKCDPSMILIVAVWFLCHMHPFLWHILESIQLYKDTTLHQYYKDIANVHKPYGIMRALQKIFFNTWQDTDKRTDFITKYTPIARYIFFLTIIVFSMNCYKLLNIKNELFEEDGYSNFPDVYRFGVPEYQCGNSLCRWFVLLFSVVIYAVSNIWIYIEYNESDDFILCIPKCFWKGYWCIPVRDLMPIDEDNVDNGCILNTSKKLINRFTLLFSVHFWRFIFTYSMCSRCGDQNNDCCSNQNTICNYLISIFCHIPLGIIILFFNIIINIIFCLLPALCFVMYIPLIMWKNKKRCERKLSPCNTSVNQETLRAICRIVGHIFLLLCYVFTLRVQVGFYILIARSFFFTIIIGLTGPSHIWNIYAIVMASLTYFATYFSEFIDSYNILLKTVFEIQAESDSIKTETGSRNDGNQQTNANTTETGSTNEGNVQTNANTTETGSTDEGNVQTNANTTETGSTDEGNVQTNANTTETGSTDEGNVQTNANTTETGSTDEGNVQTNANTTETGSTDEGNVQTNANTRQTDIIKERTFNDIVDNFYIVKKRFFLLILKTTLTVIFLSVALRILQITNNIDNNKNIMNIFPFIMIIISPKIVSMLSKNSDLDEIRIHMREIRELYIISTNRRESKESYRGDAWYGQFSTTTHKMCGCLSDVFCRLSKCFPSEIVGLLTKALFDWSNITCDHTQLLSLVDINCSLQKSPSQPTSINGYELIK